MSCRYALRDDQWKHIEPLLPGRERAEVIPHPKLNAHQQRVVAREFAMKRDRSGWLWSIQVRQALVGYFARRYKLDAKPPVDPRSHWIVLRNRTELKPFFLPEENE